MLKFLILGISLTICTILVAGSAGFLSVFGALPYTGCDMSWAGFSEADDDCDRLANSWESGVKPNSGGLDLTSGPNAAPPAGPASTNFKDIFVEIDYQTGFRPTDTAIAAIRTAFLNSGMANPSPSSTGINVHFLINEAIPASVIHDTPAGTCMSISRLPLIKNTYFGLSSSEKTNSALMTAKHGIFHYGLFIDKQCGDPGSSGWAEVGGDDFIVSLGSFPFTDTIIEGTLMHELGHNLALRHGGTEDVNCKPNYASVMNWIFQMKMYTADTPIPFPDYSKAVWPPYPAPVYGLNESNLIESVGIGPINFHTAIGGAPAGPLVQTNIPTGTGINYNLAGGTTDVGVIRNLNNFGFGLPISEDRCNAGTFGILKSKIDWSLYSGSSPFKFWGLPSQGGWDAVDPIDSATGLPITVSAVQSTLTANQSSISGNITNQSILGQANFNQPEVTIDMVRLARLQLLQGINYEIQILNDTAFAAPTLANTTKMNFDQEIISGNNSIANFTQSDKLDEAIDGLIKLRDKMDSSFGGDPKDDLIVDSKAQGRIVPLIDNCVGVLRLQIKGT